MIRSRILYSQFSYNSNTIWFKSGSSIRTCRKNGLKCVTVCGDCGGENCRNAESIISYSEEQLDETMNGELNFFVYTFIV